MKHNAVIGLLLPISLSKGNSIFSGNLFCLHRIIYLEVFYILAEKDEKL